MVANTFSTWLRSSVALIAVAAGAAALLAHTRADAPPPNADAEAALKRFGERLAEPAGDRAKLRADVLAFRIEHAGTIHAARASALLSQLRSPLDSLNPAHIPPLERFPNWQPKELAAVVGEHRGRHAAPVVCVAFSPDGTLAASGGSSYVRLWDANTLRLQSLGSYYSVSSLAFSRDSKALVVGGHGGSVSVWNIAKGNQLTQRFSVQACSTAVYSVAFAPDNKSIAAACGDNHVRLYDVSGKKIEETATLNGHTLAVSTVAYSPDGKTLASGSYDKTIRLWDMRGRDSKERALLEGSTAAVTSLAYTRKGALASAASDGTVLLWGVPAGAKPKMRVGFSPKAGSIPSLSFSPSGNTLACACSDGTVRLWNVAGALRERMKLAGHDGAVNGVAYSPDGKTLVTGGSDWTVRSWDPAAAGEKQRFMPWSHLSVAHGIDFSLDLTTLVSGSEDRVIRLWDLTKPDLKTRAYLKGDPVPIYQVAYSPDGKAVAAGGACQTVRQWDARTRQTRPTLTPVPGNVDQLLYSPDSRYILTRGRKAVVLWDAHKAQEVRRFDTHDMDIHCAAYSADGKYALTGHGIPLVKDGKQVYKNGAIVYTDCMVRMFDVDKGDELFSDKSFALPVYSAGFSVDTRQAFTGLYESALRRWDVVPPGLKAATGWKGANGYVQTMRFSPDGRCVVTSGLDGQVVLWELATGKRLKQWSLHEGVGNMTFASDSRHLALSLQTGVVYILRLEPAPAGGSR